MQINNIGQIGATIVIQLNASWSVFPDKTSKETQLEAGYWRKKIQENDASFSDKKGEWP